MLSRRDIEHAAIAKTKEHSVTKAILATVDQGDIASLEAIKLFLAVRPRHAVLDSAP